MSEHKPLITFTPVPVRPRHDGWTVERQYAFIEALAETGIVEEACRRVGMSRTSADNLRRRACGVHFRRAWQAAVDYAAHRIEENAHPRAREGIARPIFRNGEQVGEYRHYDERLTMFLLRSYRPERYGRALDRQLADDEADRDEYARNDPGIALDGQLTGIEFLANDAAPDSELHPQDCRGQSEDEADGDEPYAL